MAMGLPAGLFAQQEPDADNDIPWVKAIDIRSMTPAEAEEGRRVRLRGTVIFSDKNNAVFVQDETAGTLFWLEKNQDGPEPGDIVEVQGHTRYGLYVPGIEEVTYRVISKGPMPAPIEATYEDLISGRYHYQWIVTEGIARSFRRETETRLSMRLALGSRVIEVRLDDVQPEDVASLLDCRVRITGLASGSINDRRQLLQPYLWPHGMHGIQVLEPAPDPATAPLSPASDLLTFRPTGRSTGHRVRMGGVVLAAFPDGRVFLRDDTASLSVGLTEQAMLNVGERIEVLGFPELERFSASLADAEVVSRSPGPAPEAVQPDMREFIRGNFDNDLVTLTATVGESFRNESGHTLLLQNSARTLRAMLPAGVDPPAAGSSIQITGICQVESSKPVAYQSQPEVLSIHARSASDIRILETPSWWTTERLTAALIALAIAMLLAALWIVLLRRQVEHQTDALRERIEHEAMLEERQRIAREFHDTLEQDLTGLSLQLGAASAAARQSEARNARPLETARHLVSRIQIETRNLLKDLRTPADQAKPLAEALVAMAENVPAHAGLDLTVKAEPDLPALPPRTVHHLRMIAQESVTNVIKHASASEVAIHLAQQDGGLELTITDNGKGFDAASETWEKAGHFGCMGIRERARKLGAQVQWISTPGNGATVKVKLPIGKG